MDDKLDAGGGQVEDKKDMALAVKERTRYGAWERDERLLAAQFVGAGFVGDEEHVAHPHRLEAGHFRQQPYGRFQGGVLQLQGDLGVGKSGRALNLATE